MTSPSTPASDGPPVEIRIYRGAEGWRRVISFLHGRISDGPLLGVGPDAAVTGAQDAAEALIATLCQEFFSMPIELLAWSFDAERCDWISPVVRFNTAA